jgi:hypothetical protein
MHSLTVATGLPKGHNIQGIGFIDANTGWVGGWFKGMWTTTNGRQIVERSARSRRHHQPVRASRQFTLHRRIARDSSV